MVKKGGHLQYFVKNLSPALSLLSRLVMLIVNRCSHAHIHALVVLTLSSTEIAINMVSEVGNYEQ